MEIHHHPQTESDHAGKPGKRFKHYLFEFFMLFFAVFLGFLAENQREHIVEHNRAKAYAKSLLKDLQSDTTDINKAAAYELKTNSMIDSLVNFINEKKNSNKSGQLYYYMRLAGWMYTIDWNRATLNQLINSGNLRYFSNPQLVTEISEYNTLSNIIMTQESSIETSRMRSVTFRDQILVAKHALDFLTLNMDDIIVGKRSPFIDSLRNTEVPLQNKNFDLLNSLANALISTKTGRHLFH